MMEGLTKKSLKHVLNILESFDTYSVYSNLNDSMKANKVEENVIQKILSSHQSSIHLQSKKISESTEWLKEIIKTIDKLTEKI